MNLAPPINFQKWINDHRDLLKPPVGNQVVWSDRDFIVMVVGGPNSRTDYHINRGEEFFHQIEGDMVLRILEDGKPKDIPIRQGEIFLLPGHVPHSPQRPAGTVGLVIERRRQPGEKDGFLWICDRCHAKLHDEFLHVSDIVSQLPPVFDRFYSSPSLTTCRSCGKTHSRK
jgi:3-hydroxyanthranilate 3,4-dioxygenase